jgi:hypothetical protein
MHLLSANRLLHLTAAAVVSVVPSSMAVAQTPAPSVSLSFGVDTSIIEVRDVVRLTRAYLAAPDSSARSRGLWSTQSRFDARYGDLATTAYQGFPATIVGVTGTGPGDSVFVVKIIHATADSTRTEIRPLALQRIYAVRAPASPYGWQFSSPLPRLTHTWAHRDVGRITYWYAPGQPQSATKARQASRFVDSVAKLFSVSPPAHLDAYITGTMDEGQRLLGLDFFPEESGPGSGLGGRGGGPGILLLSNPKLGEAYLHEIVHAVLGLAVESRNSIFGEGVAVWLGGSEGRSLRELYSFLHDYQRAHPQLLLTDVFDGARLGGHDATIALYATRGLIIEAIYRDSGIPGLRRFAKVAGSPADIIRTLPTYIKGMDGDISKWWRHETEAALKR